MCRHPPVLCHWIVGLREGGAKLRIPRAFCWTKYGSESGESASAIVQRKELERELNDGTFLWGVGTSIRPSLIVLLGMEHSPRVLFSPMLSRPKSADSSPEAVYQWTGAIGLDGRPYDLPQHSLVTSRLAGGRRENRHFALVCSSRETLLGGAPGSLLHSRLRNLRTGTSVGSSQVTAVVRLSQDSDSRGSRYQVTFSATLIYPFLVELRDPVQVPNQLRLGQSSRSSWPSDVRKLLHMREASAGNHVSSGGTCSAAGA